LDRNNRLMMLALFLWASGEGLFVFIQPIYIQQLGATPTQIGGVLALSGLGVTVAFLPGGILADRGPRKLVLLIGCVLGILGVLTLALARDWRGAIPGILIYALSAVCVPAISLTIADSAGHAPLARVLTLTYSGYWAGNIVSPWAGGWLARLTSMRTVYVVAAACFAASTVIMLMISIKPGQEKIHPMTRPSWASLRLGAGLGSIVFAVFLSMFIGQPLAPNFLQNTAGWSVERIGLLGSLSALGVTFLSPALGRWSAHHKQSGLWVAQALVWCSFALLLIGAGGRPGLVYLAFLLRSGYAACRNLTNAVIAERIPAENRGLAFGLAEASVASAQMVAPYLAGLLYSRLPAAPMWAGLALIPVGMLISTLLGTRPRDASHVSQVAGSTADPQSAT
jgi:MFS family permease